MRPMTDKRSLTEGFGTAVLWDAAEHIHGPGPLVGRTILDLRLVNPGDHVAGPAYTIRMRRAGERSTEHRAQFLRCYDQAPNGSVVVIEVVDDIGGAALGDVVAHRLKTAGVVGVIVEGPIRDLNGIKDVRLPVWYRSATMAGPVTSELIVEAGVDVHVGGALVRPGDFVAADSDGAFVTPSQETERLLEVARDIVAREDSRHQQLAARRTLEEVILGGKAGAH